MSLTDIVKTVEEHVKQGEAWLAKVVEEHVPALIAEAERIQGNPIVQALEGLVLTPEVEQEIVNMIGVFARLMPPQPPAAPADPAVPAEPDTAGAAGADVPPAA